MMHRAEFEYIKSGRRVLVRVDGIIRECDEYICVAIPSPVHDLVLRTTGIDDMPKMPDLQLYNKAAIHDLLKDRGEVKASNDDAHDAMTYAAQAWLQYGIKMDSDEPVEQSIDMHEAIDRSPLWNGKAK